MAGLGSQAAGGPCAICGVSRGLWAGRPPPSLGKRKEGTQWPSCDAQRPKTFPTVGEGFAKRLGEGVDAGSGLGDGAGGPPPRGLPTPSLQVPTKCEPGCVCAEGLYENASGQCVPPEDCPCEFAGVSYPRGAQLNTDCKTW